MARVLIAGGGAGIAEAVREHGHVAESVEHAPVLGPLLPRLAGVTVLVWADGNDEQLESLLTKLVDSGVRGLVYKGGAAGWAQVQVAGERHRMPVAVVTTPAEVPAAVAAVLGG